MPDPRSEDGRFSVSWTSHSAVKRVEIIDKVTGWHTVGTHWASWDAAYQQARVLMLRRQYEEPTDDA